MASGGRRPALPYRGSRHASGAHREQRSRRVRGLRPRGPCLRQLRNEVVVSLGRPPRVIVVAGVAAGSASSIVTANLAAALARSGESTAAVATHPGGGTISVVSLLGTRPVPGLSDVFADRVGLNKAVQRAARHPSLTVIGPGGSATAGGPPRDVVDGVYEQLQSRCSYIVVDAAPMAVSADAQRLAATSDAVLLAIECGRDRIDETADAVEALARIDAPLLGAVVLPRNTIPTAPVEVTQVAAPRKAASRPAPRPRRPESPVDRPSGDDTPTETMPRVDEPETERPQTSWR